MSRITELLQLDRKIFHTNDLAILWKTANKHTLYTTISRYMDRGVLFPIYKGLYSIVPLTSLDPFELGKAIVHRYTYLSTESVLVQAGIISQLVYDYTFVSDISNKVSIGPWLFRYRQMKKEYLFNPAGILDRKGVLIASPERAVADMLYFDSKYHFDSLESIDFQKVKAIQKEIGYSNV